MADKGFGVPHTQGQVLPTVVWKDIMPAPLKANYGAYYTWDGSQNVSGVAATGGALPRQEGGEDWWYAHCNLYDGNGVQIGYAAAGYNTVPNWGVSDQQGCFDLMLDPPRTDEFETNAHRKGQLREWLARYDMNGQMVWCRSYMPGVLYGVAQASDGSIVAVGEASANRRSVTNPPPIGQGPIYYNPGITSSGDISLFNCNTTGLNGMNIKANVLKVDLQGDLIWNNFYGWPQDVADGWSVGCRAWAVKPVEDMGTPVLYVVGSGAVGFTSGEHAFAMRIREDGSLLDRHLFEATDPAVQQLGVATVEQMRPLGIDRGYIGGTQQLVISGQLRINSADPYINRAFLWHFNDIDNAPYTVSFVRSTTDAELVGEHTQSLMQHSTEALIAEENGSAVLVWPVLSNYVPGTDVSAGRSIATLKVHRFDPPGLSPTWTTDLGEVRAYDLQAGAVLTSDNSIALVSSTWEETYSVSNPFAYAQLNAAQANCLSTQFGAYNWSSTDLYDYWNTNAMVAKIALGSGALTWRLTFDADPDDPGTCFPNDLRNQECLYKITEDDDGGLVISGNTSHNFDDAYLAKIGPDCQAKLIYAELPLTEGLYTLSSDETWNTDRNVYGTIVVPNGRTLTINNGAHIRFADSEQLAWPTRIVVKTGGKLMMENATLTSIDVCPNSMWDGIQVLGNYFASQTPAEQGYVSMKNSTIENARTGLLTAQGDPGDPLGAIIKESTGGIIYAADCEFRNNVYDAVFRPYENRLANGYVQANVSKFTRCTFITDGGLHVQDNHPKTHVAMAGVRSIPYKGCNWRNTLLGPPLEIATQQGVGISSMNSSFTVTDDCNVIINYGDPCPPGSLTRSAFSNLHRGIVATTFDLSRTFMVDHASFTGCNGGIRMEGIQDAAITRNSFDVAEPFVPGLLGPTYGVYSDQCTGYSIQENHFVTSQPTGQVRKVGIVIKDSGWDANQLYNNVFDNLYVGTIVQGKNAAPDFVAGLEIKCNDYGLTDLNRFDVALTGPPVSIANQQGAVINNPQDPLQIQNPAGNRFSWNCTGTAPEFDFSVQVASNFIEYWHHSEDGAHTAPNCYDGSFIDPQDAFGLYSSKQAACPSRLVGSGHVVKLLQAGEAHEGYASTAAVYDATKDNGESEGLLAFVESGANSSTAKRNALLSVAPKVSVPVFKSALFADPPMTAWHLTQALVANSPLQGEVLKLTYECGLDPFFIDLVEGAQNGSVNLLSVLQAELAWYGQNKAEALHDLGRMTWLDSLDLGAGLDSLLAWHDGFDAWNQSLAKAGVYNAKGDYALLEAMAQNEILQSTGPVVYTVQKLLAQTMQNGGWEGPDANTLNELNTLAQDRDQLGSAHAWAWQHALGAALPEEIIILPDAEKRARPLSVLAPRRVADPVLLEAYPNPTNGPQWLVYKLPEGVGHAALYVVDITGRTVQSVTLSNGGGLLELATANWASGLYLAKLSLDGLPVQSTKLMVEH